MLEDPRHIAMVTEIESHDGSDRGWELTYAYATLSFTRRTVAQRVG